MSKTVTCLKSYAEEVEKNPSRDGYSWKDRVQRWRDQGVECYNTVTLQQIVNTHGIYSCIPLFPQMWARAVKINAYKSHTSSITDNTIIAGTTITSESMKLKEKESTMLESGKETVNKVIDQNKEAGLLAAKLSVGRTANEFIGKKLIKTLPWYKRIFVGKDGNGWLGKLLVAQVANAVIQQTSNNEKLQTIGEAMVQEAVVESTVYSGSLTSLIEGLEAAVSAPQLDKLLGEKSK